MMAPGGFAQIIDLATSTIGVVFLTLAGYWIATGLFMFAQLGWRKYKERLTRARLAR